MLAFTNTVPHFRATYVMGTTTKTLTIEDLIQSGYSSYGAVANFASILSIMDPDGVVFYQNSGWSLTAPSFIAPDIEGSTPTWSKSGIALPLESDGTVKLGAYTFNYISTIDSGAHFVLVTKTYVFSYVSPTAVISYDLSCNTSELTSDDDTDYDVVIGGVAVSPSTITYAHTIKEPLGSGYSPTPGTVAAVSRTVGGGGTAASDLWTKTWQTTISTTLAYNLDTWGIYTWIVVTDVVTGNNHIDVECDDCGCDLRQCMNNLFNRWLSAKEGNRKLELDLQSTWLEATGYWIQYETALKCGIDASEYCTALKDLLASVDCSCTTDSSSSSVRIVAVSGGSGGGGGGTPSTFVYTVTTTDPSGGNPGDVWYNKTTYHVWHNSGGTWIDDGSIQGPAGAAGANGTSTASADVIYSDISNSATPAGTGNTKLKTYALPANTFVNNGDYLLIRALFQLALNDNGKTLQLCWNGDIIATYFTDALIVAGTKFVELVGLVHRDTVLAQLNSGGVARYGGFTDTPYISNSTADLTTAINIDVYGQNAVAAASDITCKSLTVELHSLMSGTVLGATNFAQGIETLVATVTSSITFPSSFPSTGYTITWNAYDSVGQPIAVTITNKLVTGFQVTSPSSGSFEWAAILA